MITFYCFQEGSVTTLTELPEVLSLEVLPPGLIWVSLVKPDPIERKFVETHLGIELPSSEEVREIETSSRLYCENDALFMTANILNKKNGDELDTLPITYILTPTVLITLRDEPADPPCTFHLKLQAQPSLCASPEKALIAMLDFVIDRIADTLEAVDANVSKLSKTIFASPEEDLDKTKTYRHELQRIGANAFRCSKVDESLVGLTRLLAFLSTHLKQAKSKKTRPAIKALQRDALSLIGYAERLSEKLQLLLDATLGLVNIQQNIIIKIFSVAAVMFLPPTVVASLYGMNFKHMPELDWVFGYPLALLLMVLSSVIPYLFFKKRGWF